MFSTIFNGSMNQFGKLDAIFRPQSSSTYHSNNKTVVIGHLKLQAECVVWGQYVVVVDDNDPILSRGYVAAQMTTTIEARQNSALQAKWRGKFSSQSLCLLPPTLTCPPPPSLRDMI